MSDYFVNEFGGAVRHVYEPCALRSAGARGRLATATENETLPVCAQCAKRKEANDKKAAHREAVDARQRAIAELRAVPLPRAQRRKVCTTVYLEQEQATALAARAVADGRPVAELIRKSIDAFLAAEVANG